MSRELSVGLLARARDDAAAARALLPNTNVTDAIVGFHAQQAVEKSIKAVLAGRLVTFPFTHDLEGLTELCGESGVVLPEQLREHAGMLTPYAVRHRYGGEPPTLIDPDAALRLAELAITWAAKSIEEG